MIFFYDFMTATLTIRRVFFNGLIPRHQKNIKIFPKNATLETKITVKKEKKWILHNKSPLKKRLMYFILIEQYSFRKPEGAAHYS